MIVQNTAWTLVKYVCHIKDIIIRILLYGSALRYELSQ